MVTFSNLKPQNLTELVKKHLVKNVKNTKQNINNLDEQHNVKNDTSKDRNVREHFVITNEENLLKLEG